MIHSKANFKAKRAWETWVDDLRKAVDITIDRCLNEGIFDKSSDYQLHAFGDASSKAYCAVVYLVINTGDASHVRMIASKARVAPVY